MALITVYGEYATLDDGGEIYAEIEINDDILDKMKDDDCIYDIIHIKKQYPDVFYDMDEAIHQAAWEASDDIQGYCVTHTNLETILSTR